MRASLVRPAAFLSLLACMATAALPAQLRPKEQGGKGTALLYEIAFPNGHHHEAEVKVTFGAVPVGPLQLRMARSSAGRYALTEYAKNVYGVRAVNGKGQPLRVTRPDPYGWTVTGHDGTVTVTYTVYADFGSGTFSGFDAAQAHIQPQGTFMYVKALETRPVRVTVRRADPAWTIATQLTPTADPEIFTAPNLQYFFDSPVHVGAIQWREWTDTFDGRAQTWRVAVDDPTTAAVVDAYADGAKKIVREARGVFGEFPVYDYGTYTFISCYRVGCTGDGMEHRNSTSLTGGQSMGSDATPFLGVLSHEFFHSWNVKRIRPKDLEPFDYDRANMSDALWIAEGFTNYYGPLIQTRAGIVQPAAFVANLGGVINAIANGAGRRYFGPIDMSRQAPFRDGAVAPDPVTPASFISYYTYGQGIAAALDLSLRARGKSLDDVMRAMWLKYGKPEIPYVLADWRRALITVSGDSAWAADFWMRYIEGNELPDYAPLLARAGVELRPVNTSAWAGGALGPGNQAGPAATPPAPSASPSLRVSVAPPGTPLYDAGLEVGDLINSIDGKDIVTPAEYATLLAQKKPGDRLAIAYTGRAGRKTATVTLKPNPTLEAVLYEAAGKTPTAEQLAFRAKWLGAKTP